MRILQVSGKTIDMEKSSSSANLLKWGTCAVQCLAANIGGVIILPVVKITNKQVSVFPEKVELLLWNPAALQRSCNIHSRGHFPEISRLIRACTHQRRCCWPSDPHRAAWMQSVRGITRQATEEEPNIFMFFFFFLKEWELPATQWIQCCHLPNCMNGDIISCSWQRTLEPRWTVLATQRELWSGECVLSAPRAPAGFTALAALARCSVWSVTGGIEPDHSGWKQKLIFARRDITRLLLLSDMRNDWTRTNAKETMSVVAASVMWVRWVGGEFFVLAI